MKQDWVRDLCNKQAGNDHILESNGGNGEKYPEFKDT